jgi:hypothetical protein
MTRLTNLFKKSKERRPQHGASRATQNTPPDTPHHAPPVDNLLQRTLEAAYGLPPGDVAGELQHVQTYMQLTSARIQHLQRLMEHEGATAARTAELRRELKDTHQGLEKFRQEVGREHGEDAARPLENAKEKVWQALEEMEDVERTDNEEIEDGGECLMSGALPVEDKGSRVFPEASPHTLQILKDLPNLIARGDRWRFGIASDSDRDPTDPLDHDIELEETNPERWPQPRDEVIARLQSEEANSSLHVTDPHKVRRGSCNGFMITDMVMSGVEDDNFVLPYLHHIKHHEVRVLKKWLTGNNLIQRSGTLSRMEKVLHAIQLLQTGSRYESIAVLFSRTPSQVRESCHEVLAGMLDLYDATVDDTVVPEVYAPLWGITKRCALNEDAERAERYFGFRWTEVAKVLIALNLYIGRSRGSKSPFEGRPFPWGRFLGVAEPGLEVEKQDSNEESRRTGGSTSSSSPYEEPVIQAIARPI